MDYFLAFWGGMCLGSFVNVLVYRLPREQSVVFPRSRCPHCRAPIAFYDNVPVLSWLWLRGRCRACRGRIAPRYPAVELAVGFLALAVWSRWKAAPVWAGLAAVSAGIYLAIALIDWDTFIIPDVLSLPLLAVGLAASPGSPFFGEAGGLARFLHSFGGAVFGLLICWGVAVAGEKIFKKEAMGGGDIKLLAAVGAWTGVLGAFDCMIVASFFGAAYGVSLIARGRLKRSDPIPFGPFLSAAAVFNLFYLLPPGFPFLTR